MFAADVLQVPIYLSTYLFSTWSSIMAAVITKQFTPYQPKPDEEYMSKSQLNHLKSYEND